MSLRLSIKGQGNAGMGLRRRFAERLAIQAIVLLCLFFMLERPALAVVGQAEKYDEFSEEDLEHFHKEVLMEEKEETMDTTVSRLQQLKQIRQEDMTDNEKKELEFLKGQSVEALEKELLGIPERDRIKFGFDGQHRYDSNIKRLLPRKEKDDSVFDVKGFTEFDLSGRKTDLRLEVRGGKQWNVEFPTSDYWNVEERIRYRRKYFKKLHHAFSSRLARTSSKTVELNQKRIRYDSHQNMTFNMNLFRKLGVAAEFNWIKRLFTTEPFDQDSSWEVSMGSNAVWNFTPKSRINAGYKFGSTGIRTKSGNANSHEIHAGYFGRLTRKSSASVDVSFTHQTPRSQDTATVNTWNLGVGFIYQLTPKTQITTQLLRSQQNSSSERVEGTENDTVKTDQFYTNNSMSVSINSRLRDKITATLSATASHLHTRVEKDGDRGSETQQFSFPVTISIDYIMKRWLRWRFAYTFSYRTGDEKPDTYRVHQLTTGVNMTF